MLPRSADKIIKSRLQPRLGWLVGKRFAEPRCPLPTKVAPEQVLSSATQSWQFVSAGSYFENPLERARWRVAGGQFSATPHSRGCGKLHAKRTVGNPAYDTHARTPHTAFPKATICARSLCERSDPIFAWFTASSRPGAKVFLPRTTYSKALAQCRPCPHGGRHEDFSARDRKLCRTFETNNFWTTQNPTHLLVCMFRLLGF